MFTSELVCYIGFKVEGVCEWVDKWLGKEVDDCPDWKLDLRQTEESVRWLDSGKRCLKLVNFHLHLLWLIFRVVFS